MWQGLNAWLARLPYNDSLERRNALLLARMELGIAVVALLMVPVTWLARRALMVTLAIDSMLIFAAAICFGGVLLLRRGRLEASALLVSGMIVLVLSLLIFGNTLRDSSVMLFAYALPIAIGGMLAGRRGVVLACIASILGVCGAVLLQVVGAPGAGFAVRNADPTASTLISFAVLAGLLGFFIDALRSQARDALAARRQREQELEQLSRRLEQSVRERTADLEIAMSALEQRAAEAERLVAENSSQREAIRALSVPVLPLDGRTLVMPLVGELDGPRLEAVQEQALAAVEQLSARRLLLDITGVPLIDTYVAQSLLRTLAAARLLGAEVVLVGVRPEVAQSMVGLGIDLGGLRTFADLQSALR